MADELNVRVRMQVRASRLQAVPVDDTLSIPGQAADAAATGAALAQKADISQVTGIHVNGQGADMQGLIFIDGSDIPVSGEDATKLDAAIAALQARNATDIPMSAEAGAQSIADAVNGSISRNADAIPMSAEDATTVKQAADALRTDVTDLQGRMETEEGKTAGDIPMSAETGADSVAERIAADGERIGALEAQDAGDIPYESGGADSIADRIAGLEEGRVRSVNDVQADENGNILIGTVPYADDLTTDENVQVDAAFIVRTAGGRASIKTGNAWVRRIKGNSVHTGFVAEKLKMDVMPEEREDPGDEITATLDRAIFTTYVTEDAVISLVYSTEWKVAGEAADPLDYGITVTGTPIAGDMIVVTYVKEERGTITPAEPEDLHSTGWNLFDAANGWARVTPYDGKYKIGGTFSTIRFTEEPGGASSPVTVDAAGLFTVDKAGYVLVTGGNTTDTYVICCWTDWEGGYAGDFAPYEEDVIDLTTIMQSLPNGMCSIGNVFDEINFNTKQIIQRISRVPYSEEARAAAAATGRAYDFDETYVYLEMTPEEIAAAISSFALENQYTVNEHGLEFFTGTNAPAGTEIAYGASLKDKLRRDVLTLSQQTLTEDQQAQVLENIGADAVTSPIRAILNEAILLVEKSCAVAAVSANKTKGLTAAAFGFEEIEGYTPVAVVRFAVGSSALCPYAINPVTSGNVLTLRNVTSSATSATTATVVMMYVRDELLPAAGGQ